VTSELHFKAHPSEDALEEYAFDRLPEDQTATLEEHLLVCSVCQDRLRAVDEYILLMKHAARNDQTGSRARPLAFRERTWTVAVAVAAMVLGGVLFMLPRGPVNAVPLELVAFRGSQMPHTAADRRVDLTLDLSGLPPAAVYHVQVVNATGREEWSGQGTASGAKLLARVPKALDRGIHWVRVSSTGGELLREFGFRAD
jgi:hypothetical protein